jgi:biopolymer transport protein ExbD
VTLRAAALVGACLLSVACFSLRRLEAACAEGDPSACDDLGARYAFGDGVPRDPSRATELSTRAWDLCGPDAGALPGCALVIARHGIVRVDAVPLGAAGTTGAGNAAVLSVILFADGRTRVDDTPLPDDDAILVIAKSRASGDVRAVIKADASVAHGRVVHVLDLLKQAGISRIAFGVTAVPAVPAVPAGAAASGGPPLPDARAPAAGNHSAGGW